MLPFGLQAVAYVLCGSARRLRFPDTNADTRRSIPGGDSCFCQTVCPLCEQGVWAEVLDPFQCRVPQRVHA